MYLQQKTKLATFALILLFSISAFAQKSNESLTQSIRGIVTDAASSSPLSYVNMKIVLIIIGILIILLNTKKALSLQPMFKAKKESVK